MSFDVKTLDLLIEDYPVDVDAHPYNKQIEDLSVGTFGKVWHENLPKENCLCWGVSTFMVIVGFFAGTKSNKQ